jgi:hypothetical protein
MEPDLSLGNYLPEILDGLEQAFLQFYLGIPVQFFSHQGDIGATPYRIILRKRFEDNLRGALGEADDFFSELDDGALAGITEIDRTNNVIGFHDSHKAPAVGVENTADFDIDVVLAIIIHHKGFGNAFPLIVTASDTYRIYVSPVAFGLRVNLRISIHLGCRSEENSSLSPLGQTQHVDGSHNIGFNGFYSVILIGYGGSRTGKMVD